MAAALGSNSTASGGTQKFTCETPAVLVKNHFFPFLLLEVVEFLKSSFPKVVTVMVEPVLYMCNNSVNGEVV